MTVRLKRDPKLRYGKPAPATLLGAPATKACKVGKVGGKDAVQVCLTRPHGQGPQVLTVEAACSVLKELGTRDRESFVTVSLDARGAVLGVEEVARGSVAGVDVHPREVFKAPIILGASGIILAHNHPSGDAQPSSDDAALTNRMKEIGTLLGIPVLDHIIVAQGGKCTSLADRGLVGTYLGVKPRRRRR